MYRCPVLRCVCGTILVGSNITQLDSEVPDDITATTEPEPAKSMQTQGTQTPFSSLKVDKALIEAAEALGITAGDEQAPLTEHLYLPINTDDHGEVLGPMI